MTQANTQLKAYNGSAWVTSSAFSTINIGDLANVVTTTLAAGSILYYDGTNFTNNALTLDLVANTGNSTSQTLTIGTPTASGHAATGLR